MPSPIGQQLHDPDTLRHGFALPVPSILICSSGRMGVSKRITALPAGQLYHSFAQTFLSTLAGTAGASALVSRAIRVRHHYHDLQIADGDTGLRHTKGGVTFGLSPRRFSDRANSLSTKRLRQSGTQLLTWPLPLSGFFLPRPDTTVCGFERFCPTASRDPGSGTSLRLTIP